MTVKELLEKRNALFKGELTTLRDAFNANDQQWQDAEQEQRWVAVNAEYDQLSEQIESQRSAEQVASRFRELEEEQTRSINDGRRIPGTDDRTGGDQFRNEDPITEETRTLALAAWIRANSGRPIPEQQMAACQRLRMNPMASTLEFSMPGTQRYRDLQAAMRSVHHSRSLDAIRESRALSAYTLSAGGVTVPNSLVQSLEINMLAFGGMRQVAETIITSDGGELAWPTADDTSNTGEQLGESGSIGSSTDPTFGAVTWNAYKFSSKPVLVPYELLEDSVFDLPRVLGEMLGERLGRITNTKYTTGSGGATPKGIVTAATLGVTAASATAIAASEIFDLVHSVDPAYRMGARFMMHDNIVLHLRKLTNGDGDYLWQSGMREGVPDRLADYGITINQDMASSVATTNKTILFGQLSKYKIRRVNTIRMYRLEERYRDNDQDGFIAFVREDGNLLDAGTAPVKYLQQA